MNLTDVVNEGSNHRDTRNTILKPWNLEVLWGNGGKQTALNGENSGTNGLKENEPAFFCRNRDVNRFARSSRKEPKAFLARNVTWNALRPVNRVPTALFPTIRQLALVGKIQAAGFDRFAKRRVCQLMNIKLHLFS